MITKLFLVLTTDSTTIFFQVDLSFGAGIYVHVCFCAFKNQVYMNLFKSWATTEYVDYSKNEIQITDQLFCNL